MKAGRRLAGPAWRRTRRMLAAASRPAAPQRQGAKPPAWRGLREHGLRAEAGLRLFGAGVDSVRIRFEAPVQINNAQMHLYRGFAIGRYSFLRTGTVRHLESIGRYTSIGPGVILGEGEHPARWLTTSPTVFDPHRWFFYPPADHAARRLVVPRTEENTDPGTRGKVSVGNDVWIGANVIIRRGVTIGDGAIVAAGAFVNRDVPPYAIVGGLPAKPLGMRFDPDTIERLLEFRWWEFDLSDLPSLPYDHPRDAVDEIAAQETAGTAHRTPLAYSSVRLTRHGWHSLTEPDGE